MKKENKNEAPTFKTLEVATLVIITCVVSLLMGIIISKPAKKEKYELADSEIQDFIKQYNYIIDNYYGEIDKKALLEAALKGMIEALDDPYSSYLDDDYSSKFKAELNGSYNGIGIEVANNVSGDIVIMKVFENTPASQAGIKPLDIIISLNDQDVKKLSTKEFTELVKKVNNTDFTLGIKRKEEIKNVKVSKKNVTLNSVTSKTINIENKKIGYMYISIFAMNTDLQFQTKLEELENDNIDSLIIDLRGNGGGHLSSVENMISLFLDKSNVIYQIKDKEKTTKHYSKGNVTKKYPVVVLVDENSASASEMMTAALKESYGAIIVGKTTFGKGTVQELQDSSNSQYKITTKKWLTPNGKWINEKGIKPDIEIELDKNYLQNPTDDNDNQLQKAIEILKK